MRLVDADELLKCKCDVYDTDNHLLYAVPTGNIISSKTVDAQPIVHAHWNVTKEMLYLLDNHEMVLATCSNCGDRMFVDSPKDLDSYKYCPNCGARMDEVINNE